jgi:hypothetical protein
LTLQLEPNTPGHPAAAYIREQRFDSVDELKAYIAGLPPGTHIFFRWWTDSHHQQSPFYIARGELRKFCAERSVEFRIDTAPFW